MVNHYESGDNASTDKVTVDGSVKEDEETILEEENVTRNVPSSVVPLNIQLTKEKHLLIISGPNAGGKSVCLKTVGLLQYMLQCGLPFLLVTVQQRECSMIS